MHIHDRSLGGPGARRASGSGQETEEEIGIVAKAKHEKEVERAKARKAANRFTTGLPMVAKSVGGGTIPENVAASTVAGCMFANYASVSAPCMRVMAAARPRTRQGEVLREAESPPDKAERRTLPQVRQRWRAQRGAHDKVAL